MKKLLFALALVPAIAGAEVIDTFQKIVDALAAAQSGAEVVVAPGTYGMTGQLTIPAGVTLRSRDGRDTTTFTMDEGVSSLSLAVKLSGKDSVLSGFTFNGIKNTESGSARLVEMSSGNGGVMTNCVVTSCRLFSGAVGIGKSARVSDCVFDSNSVVAPNVGLIFVPAGTTGAATFDHLQVTRNRAVKQNSDGNYKNSYGGVGYFTSGGSYTFRNCTFADNWCKQGDSAAINSQYRSMTVQDCIIVVSSVLPFSMLKGVAVTKNSSGAYNLTVRNCFLNGVKSCSTDYSGVVEGWDPGFVNPANGDYRLRSDSPCVGKGKNGGDIGCYAYDPDYKDPTPVLTVGADGDYATIQEAYAAAKSGTRIEIASGVHMITNESLKVGKAVHLVGVGGREKTIVKSANVSFDKGFRPLYLNSELATVRGLTFAGARNKQAYEGTHGGGGVCIGNMGGGLIDCRITDCTDNSNGKIMGVSILCGYMDRCLVDACSGNGPAVATYSTKRDAGFADSRGIVLNSQICYNTNSAANGQALLLQVKSSGAKSSLGYCPQVYNSTIACNKADFAVQRVYGTVRNCIIRDANDGETLCWRDGGTEGNEGKTVTPTLATTGTTSVAWRNICTPVAVGTNCVVSAPNFLSRRVGKFKLREASPCVGAAQALSDYAAPFDFAGNPRVREDGTQDIGCNQWMPSGLLMMVR